MQNKMYGSMLVFNKMLYQGGCKATYFILSTILFSQELCEVGQMERV